MPKVISLFIPTPLEVYRCPRVTKFGTFSPHQKAKERLRWLVKSLYLGEPLEGPIEAHFRFVRPIPKSSTKKQKELMLKGAIAPTSRPDGSNYQKFFEDAFIGIFWHDDAQIVTWSGCKRYGAEEGIYIEVESYYNFDEESSFKGE